MLYSYANLNFFSMIFIRKGKKFVSKQGQSQPHVHLEARVTLLITIIWSILKTKNDKVYETVVL